MEAELLRSRGRLVGALACLASACGGRTVIPPSFDDVSLAPVRDLNPAPDVVEIDLEARPGIAHYRADWDTRVWTYNGSVPGPLIDVRVGQRLVIHFTNRLPEPTTIHWHGIRLPNAMDGTASVQDPVPPGGRFEYSFVLRDAGLYWYHPHVRSDEQMAKGLYGVIRVRGDDEPDADEERIFALNDVSLDATGELPSYIDDYRALPDSFKRHGRVGDLLLVNGKIAPLMPIRAGTVNRWRLLNAANSRYFALSIPGHSFRVLGTDGGYFEKPYDVDDLVIAPSERYDVMLVPGAAPETDLPLNTLPYQRAEDDLLAGGRVATFRVTGDAGRAQRALPSSFPALEPLPTGPPFMITFGEGLEGKDQHIDHDPPLSPGDPVFTINGKAGMEIPPIMAALGEVKTFDVVNQTHEAHVFHLHGFFFQLQAIDDVPVPPDRLVSKDSMNLAQSVHYRLAARFDEIGSWMYHCHIPEHSESGMMAEIHVEAR